MFTFRETIAANSGAERHATVGYAKEQRGGNWVGLEMENSSRITGKKLQMEAKTPSCKDGATPVDRDVRERLHDLYQEA